MNEARPTVTAEKLSLRERFINPHWLNGIRHGAQRCIKAAGHVTLDGVALDFPADSAIADGTEVEVWFTRDFWAAPVAALAAAEAARQAAEARRQEDLAARAAQAVAFNRALAIPVPWGPAIKDVLSGLSASSMGDGSNRRTVTHVRLKAPLTGGRLVRSAGDFLCTAASGSNGRGWSNQADQPESTRVTCKTCLALAARWQRAGG